jgi:hypothetical protein
MQSYIAVSNQTNYFLRGGPTFLVPPSVNTWLQMATDQEKNSLLPFRMSTGLAEITAASVRFKSGLYFPAHRRHHGFCYTCLTLNQRELQYVTHKVSLCRRPVRFCFCGSANPENVAPP